jgi:hypothetical protein
VCRDHGEQAPSFRRWELGRPCVGDEVKAQMALPGLLLVVAGAAAVLSFAALRDLALLCGFSSRLAWLLPVVVDAGAASGSLVWLGGWARDSARRFARALALGLLGLSVAANALGHGLAAFSLAPPWWVVVVVSAIAPGVLGAVVHLAVLVGRTESSDVEELALSEEDGAQQPVGEWLDDDGMSKWWDVAPAATSRPGDGDRAAELIAAGVGRRRLSRELGMSEYEARQLLSRTRQYRDRTHGTNTTSDAGAAESNGELR